MIELQTDIQQHLVRSGTLLVPTRQRAAAVRLAYDAAMLAAGRRVWSTPDVVPWNAWLERELERARQRGEPVPIRLSEISDWLLWRDCVVECASTLPILAPERLVDAVREAVGLLEDHGFELRADSPETAFLLAVRAAYRRHCRQLGVLGCDSWRDCAPFVRVSAATLAVGFGPLGAARHRWLTSCGVTGIEDAAGLDGAGAGAVAGSLHAAGVDPVAGVGDSAAEPEVRALADAAQEAQAAAEWCAAALARDPSTRLLIVVPRLAAQRHLWQRALSQRLDYELILAATVGAAAGAEAEPAYAIEGGAPLAEHPLVATALGLIALAAAAQPFERLSGVLRSPYLGLDRAQCLRLELWLREQPVEALDATTLQTLVAPVSALLGQGAAELLRALARALGSVPASATDTAGAATATDSAMPAARTGWARAFAELLERCGWPGHAALGSAEQQVHERFEELLGEFGTRDPARGRLTCGEAAALLQELAQRTAFEPVNDDVPITVTASLEDPVVRYDGVWVAGLTAEVWPPAAHPDPFIPLPLQRRAGIAAASAAGQLQRARAMQRQWWCAGRRCVLSWPHSDQELPADASPLLPRPAAGPVSQPDDGHGGAAAADFAIEPWLAGRAPPLEPWTDRRGPGWPAGRPPGGGTRLLELQARCPFRGFAELRLGAQPLQAAAPGVTPRERGRILHRALELFWRQIGDLDVLRARDEAAVHALARECAARAVSELAPAGGELRTLLLAREVERDGALIGRLAEWERERSHFVTQALECSRPLSMAGSTLQLRLDRIDRLDDGRLVVIDYKSGLLGSFDAYAERPSQPQLPAYALVEAERVAAVLAVHPGREGVSLRGIADRPDRVARLANAVDDAADWSRLLGQWRQRLQGLVAEFLDGHAAVDPQAGACEHCHLQLLCRVDVRRFATGPGDEDAAAQAPPA